MRYLVVPCCFLATASACLQLRVFIISMHWIDAMQSAHIYSISDSSLNIYMYMFVLYMLQYIHIYIYISVMIIDVRKCADRTKDSESHRARRYMRE